jgi:hypothetical protein
LMASRTVLLKAYELVGSGGILGEGTIATHGRPSET